VGGGLTVLVVVAGLLHTLPHRVTTFAVCPVPVGVGTVSSTNQPSSKSGGGADCVAVIAAVTAAGNVELVTLQRGPLTPLSATISVSLSVGCAQSSHTVLATQQFLCQLGQLSDLGRLQRYSGTVCVSLACQGFVAGLAS
jgi:hypothetical protein